MLSKWNVYLAGPISNCNEDQRTKWRKEFRRLVNKERKRGDDYTPEFRMIDPTEHRISWSPDKEMTDIDECNVVVANLWKESMGTVLGIFHARQQGKPVIVIDPNFLNSKVVGFLVEPERPLASLEAAAARLIKISSGPLKVMVRKSSGKTVQFSYRRFLNSLKSASIAAGVDEDHWSILISASVISRIQDESKKQTIIETVRIKKLIHEKLEEIQRGNSPYTDKTRADAKRFTEAWAKHQEFKNAEEMAELYSQDVKSRDRQIADLQKENARLRKSVKPASTTMVRGTRRTKFRHLVHAVEQAEKDFRDTLSLSDNALSSAQAHVFPNYGVAYDGLRFLSMLAISFREDRSEAKPAKRQTGIRERLKQFGWEHDYSKESKTTRGDRTLKKYRKFRFGSETVMCEDHLKVGIGKHMLRIYFNVVPSSTCRVFIGHIGDHLPTATDPH